MPMTLTISKPKLFDTELHCSVSFTNTQPCRGECDASYTNQSRIQVAQQPQPSTSKKDKFKSKYLKEVQYFTEEFLYVCFQSETNVQIRATCRFPDTHLPVEADKCQNVDSFKSSKLKLKNLKSQVEEGRANPYV